MIVAKLLKQYSSKNIKVKIAVIKTLSVVTLIMQNELEKHLAAIVPIIYQSLSDNNNDILTYSLSILQQGFRNFDPMMASQVAQKESESISKFLLTAMAHNQSNLASEAFRVTGQFALQLVAVDGAARAEHADTYKTLYASILQTLQQQNIAQEIKQTAMIAMAKLICVAHTVFAPQQIDEVVKIYADRL